MNVKKEHIAEINLKVEVVLAVFFKTTFVIVIIFFLAV